MKETNRGFTLIEILVVVFIIAVVVAAATITLGDNQAERLEQKSQQLAAIINFAKEQAIFNSEELGVLFTNNTFSFYRLNETQNTDEPVWEVVQGDKLLEQYTLPDGLQYELFFEGIKVKYTNNEKKIIPQVYILSDGSVTPFQVKITDKIDHANMLTVAENGEFKYEAIN